MTSIRDRILARADLTPLVASRDLDRLAAALNETPSTSVQSRYVTMRTLVAECDDANSIIAALISASSSMAVVAEMLTFLRSDSGMDVGHPKTQAQLDAMASGGALTTAQADALKNMALQPDLVTRADVEAAMFNPDGTEKPA